MQGTVSFFHDSKGYGFIDSDDADDDVFFHISEVEGLAETVDEDIEVTFEVEDAPKGPRAINVEYQ